MKSLLLFWIQYMNNKNNGQSMVEYLLIITLISLVIIVAITNFGDSLLDLYTTFRDTLLGL